MQLITTAFTHFTDALTSSLFCDADVDQGGTLTYDELKGQLGKYPGLLENLASRCVSKFALANPLTTKIIFLCYFQFSIERWLVPEKPKQKPKAPFIASLKSKIPHQFSWHYIKNNHIFLGWLSLIIMINIALFAQRAIIYHRDNPTATTWLVVARGCGKQSRFQEISQTLLIYELN
jgi:hypothetical protein